MIIQLNTKLSKNQEKVLCYMVKNTKSKRDAILPTVIGKDAGGENSNGRIRNSSWSIPILKKLIEKGLVYFQGREKGYSVTTEGRKLAKKLN